MLTGAKLALSDIEIPQAKKESSEWPNPQALMSDPFIAFLHLKMDTKLDTKLRNEHYNLTLTPNNDR